MIEIKNMSKIYPNGKGVFNINFTIKDGEVFGFLGPNGAGKTTTIRQLLGFTNATSGECLINGLDTRKESSQIQKFLGYLPGEIAFFENMTGLEFLNFLTKLRGNESNLMEELIEYYELDANGKINRMSKGMKQKLGLVAAFMHDPKVLILDEPTSGLDPLMQRKFINHINEEKKKGKTILMSSHMFDEVDRTCSRAAIIKDGKIVAIDDICSLKIHANKRYLVTFASNNDLNIFKQSNLKYNIVGDMKIEVLITNELNKFLSILSKCNVLNLDASEQSLEQIFIKYYGKDE